MRRFAFIALFALAPLSAHADETRTLTKGRVLVGDLVAGLPESAAKVDLGPAPPPGGSRLVARDEIDAHLKRAGVDTSKLKLPPSVRVVTASTRVSPDALAIMATPAVEKTLPRGVTLVKIEPAHEVVLAQGARVKAASITRPPRQKGQFRTSALLDIGTDDGELLKIPVSVLVDVDDAGAKADVPRGTRINIVLEQRSLRITTTATAMSDAEIGDTTNVTITATGRVVKARVTAPDSAQIVGQP